MNMFIRRIQLQAFTLIETLIYLALFSMVLSSMFAGMSTITESSSRNSTLAFLDTEGAFLLEKIGYELEHTQNSSDSPTLITETGGQLLLQTTSGLVPFSSPDVTVSSTTITRNINSDTSTTSLLVRFTLTAITPNGKRVSQKFSRSYYPLP